MKTYKKHNSSKLVLSSLVISAVLAMARIAIPARVEAIGSPFLWSQQVDIEGPIDSEFASAISDDGETLVFVVDNESGNSLYISRDFGASWENIADVVEDASEPARTLHRWSSVDMSNDGQKIVVSSYYSVAGYGLGAIFISEDNGETWQEITPELENYSFTHVSIAGESGKIVAINSIDNENVYISTDDGASWTTSPIEPIFDWDSLSVSDDGENILIGGENQNVNLSSFLYQSTDGGASWQDINPDTRDGDGGHTSTDMSSDGNKIIVRTSGYDGEQYYDIYFSDDMGASWSEITPMGDGDSEWDVAISGNGNVVSAYDINSSAGISVSDDNGSSWSEEDPGLEFDDGAGVWRSLVLNYNGSRIGALGENYAYTGYNSSLDSDTAIISNAEDGKEVKITTGSGIIITCSIADRESDTSRDRYYSYPLGLINFCVNGVDGSTEITLLFVTDLTPSEVTLRKYNPDEGAYSTISGANISETSYEGSHALLVSYSISDNGPLDLNPATGEITDPVGLGIEEIGVPNTGLSYQVVTKYDASAVHAISSGSVLVSILHENIVVRK